MSPLLQVTIGGAAGAALRHLVGRGVVRLTGEAAGFPVAILAINVVGSFVMGALVVWAAQRGLAQWMPLLAGGVLGGFTTFSTFSLEAVRLWERGDTGLAVLYVGLSVGLSLAALALAAALVRAHLS